MRNAKKKQFILPCLYVELTRASDTNYSDENISVFSPRRWISSEMDKAGDYICLLAARLHMAAPTRTLKPPEYGALVTTVTVRNIKRQTPAMPPVRT